jgi:hypothetical protein
MILLLPRRYYLSYGCFGINTLGDARRRRGAGRVSFARCHTRWVRVEKQLFVSKGQRTLLILKIPLALVWRRENIFVQNMSEKGVKF